MSVDSFKFLPSSLKKAYKNETFSTPDEIPFTSTTTTKGENSGTDYNGRYLG